MDIRYDLPAVGGRRLPGSHAEFEHRCLVHLKEEQEKINPDNALIALLCDTDGSCQSRETRLRQFSTRQMQQTILACQCRNRSRRLSEWSPHNESDALPQPALTSGDYTTFYPYKADEERLRIAGYNVLVFIASQEGE